MCEVNPIAKTSRIIGYFGERLDFFAGIAVVFGGAIITLGGYSVRAPETTEAGLAMLGASTFYLIFRNRNNSLATQYISLNLSLSLLLNIIFFSALAAGVFLAHASLYRPPAYFLLMSICVATVAIEILSSKTGFQVGLSLCKILLLALVLRAEMFYEVPGFLGSDAWLHEANISHWIETGHITTDVPALKGGEGYSGYAYFPVLHLMVIGTRLVTEVSPKDSLFLSVGLFYISSILFVFLIGQRLSGRTFGLLVALFISIIPPHIASGVMLIPNSLGVAIFAIIIFLIIRKGVTVINTSFFVLFMILLVISHTISSFVTLITLAVILITSKICAMLERQRNEQINTGIYALFLFIVILISYWSYIYYYPGQSFFDSLARPVLLSLKSGVGDMVGIVQIPSESPLNRVWYHMFIGMVVIGTLSWLSARSRNNLRIILSTSTVVLSLLVILLPMFTKYLLTPRWVAFIIVIGSPLVIQGIFVVSGIAKQKTVQAILLVLVVFIFTTFSINSPIVARNSILTKEVTRRDFIQSELSAAGTISGKYNGMIITDWEYAEFILSSRYPIDHLRYLSPEVNYNSALIVIRDYMQKYPYFLHWGWRAKGVPSPEEIAALFIKISSPENNVIYDSGELRAYQFRRQIR